MAEFLNDSAMREMVGRVESASSNPDDRARLVAYEIGNYIGFTDKEQRLLRLLGQAAEYYAQVLKENRARREPDVTYPTGGLSENDRNDLNEFVHHIHDLQHAVMAEVARRAHPIFLR